MLKSLFRTALALGASLMIASPAMAHVRHHYGHHHWKPYVIEKNCVGDGFSHCDVRIDYAPGQHAGLAGPGSYWYQRAYHHRHHHRHHRYGKSRHVAWCTNRYRTYDPHSDTFVGKGYHRYRCNSPY